MQGPPRSSDIVDIWGHRGETGADDKLKEVIASKQQVDWNHSLTLSKKKKGGKYENMVNYGSQFYFIFFFGYRIHFPIGWGDWTSAEEETEHEIKIELLIKQILKWNGRRKKQKHNQNI